MFPHEAEHLLEADKSLLDVGVGVRPLAIRCWDNQIDGQLSCSSHPNFERCHSSGRVHLGVEGECGHGQKPAPTRIFARQVGAHDAVQCSVESFHQV